MLVVTHNAAANLPPWLLVPSGHCLSMHSLFGCTFLCTLFSAVAAAFGSWHLDARIHGSFNAPPANGQRVLATSIPFALYLISADNVVVIVTQAADWLCVHWPGASRFPRDERRNVILRLNLFPKINKHYLKFNQNKAFFI